MRPAPEGKSGAYTTSLNHTVVGRSSVRGAGAGSTRMNR
jgi:hypothetical protein